MIDGMPCLRRHCFPFNIISIDTLLQSFAHFYDYLRGNDQNTYIVGIKQTSNTLHYFGAIN